MEYDFISVFDMLKIGVGPSSSHTLGPWRAAQFFLSEADVFLNTKEELEIQVNLYGSLSLTGKGHATDLAIILGLSGFDPVSIPTNQIHEVVRLVQKTNCLLLNGKKKVNFNPQKNIVFNREFLPFHANGLTFTVSYGKEKLSSTFYSIGGGFVVKENDNFSKTLKLNSDFFPYPITKASELLNYAVNHNKNISAIVLENEKALRTDSEIKDELDKIWKVMLNSIYTGCHTEGILPGGLEIKRRAYEMHKSLIGKAAYSNQEEWIMAIRKTEVKFRQILKWVSCFALAVNEVNASLGRVVTAPTNGSAGVIPAVLLYYLTIENHQANDNDIHKFLLVAGELGSIFKKGSTISAAMGGCQAEIGVSSAMAAGALCELMGGTPIQVLNAAEIAMEHHLGLTCDPINGLVQIPCIERNTMGAIKAINAAELALASDGSHAKVSLDKVINTMWETAKDMNSKYKETSEGGLAISVNLPDC